MGIFYHTYDLPKDINFTGDIAIDTEAMGLNNFRDRLCVIQIGDGQGNAHLIHYPEPQYDSPNLKKLLADSAKVKIFHFARFDMAIIKYYLQLKIENVFCTKIASKLARTYTDGHSLKDLCAELLEIKISKQQQSSDWGAKELTQEQMQYAAADVLHLHALRNKLNQMLKREKRDILASQCFAFLPTKIDLDLSGWKDIDIFTH